MFQVRLRAMEENADELQMQLRKLRQASDDLNCTRKGLGQLSGMDGVRRALDREFSNIESQQRKLFSLLTVLQQSSRYYRNCENGIIDHAEYSSRRRRRSTWYEINLNPEVSDIIGQIIY